MTTIPRFDGLADWYDERMHDPNDRHPLAEAGQRILADLVGPGSGQILDIGCGTGMNAAFVRSLGYDPVGIDLSTDQLRIAATRLPVAAGDAARLPIAGEAFDLAFSTFVLGDLDDLAGAMAEVHRVLRPGGRYVTLCVHPCFYGNHSEPREDGSIVVHPGYANGGFAVTSRYGTTIRSRVGAWHRPLPDLVNTFLEAGLVVRRVAEGGDREIPSILAFELVKAAA